MEEKEIKVDPETGEVLNVDEIKDAINSMEEIFKEEPTERSPMSSLLDLDVLDDTLFKEDDKKPVPYTTELIENIKKLEPTLTTEQLRELIDYVKGSTRPAFMDTMLTQTNDKLIESLKVMTILQLLRLPSLYDYLNSLQTNMLDKDSIAKMSFEDISKTSVNIQKEIADILSLGLKVASSLPNTNTVPTKVEKLANALMGVSESTRQRIEEIIAMEQ